MIVDINKNKPHEVAELICLKCYCRWYGAYNKEIQLRNIICPNCGVPGFVIKTGQTIELIREKACSYCSLFKDEKCKLNLDYDDNIGCEYFIKDKHNNM